MLWKLLVAPWLPIIENMTEYGCNLLAPSMKPLDSLARDRCVRSLSHLFAGKLTVCCRKSQFLVGKSNITMGYSSGWWWLCPSWKMMEFVNGKDYPIPYMKWKIIQMFQTTNQVGFPHLFDTSISLRAIDPPLSSTPTLKFPGESTSRSQKNVVANSSGPSAKRPP